MSAFTQPRSQPPDSHFAGTLRGVTVGGYRIEDEIGRGGTGIVYRAMHPLLGTSAAVKVLHPELYGRPDVVNRFVAEARAVAALEHPHIVRVYDLAPLPDGRLCTVMEHLEGPTLEQFSREPMAAGQARGILLQLCSALSAVHQRGFVHRDLKAQNVVVVRGGAREHVKLLDFGLARVEARESGLTMPGVILGTPHYMAPEQVLGEPVDRRADVYALGVLAYRLLTGAVPFNGAPAEVMFHHVRTAPPQPANMVPALRQLVLTAMAKRREDRFPDMAQFARALQSCVLDHGQPVPLPRAPLFVSRVEGAEIILRFASQAAFDHVDRYEFSMGRIFVPGQAPRLPGLLRLVVQVPGRPAMAAPATLLGLFDSLAARKHGIPEGFALTLRGRFSPVPDDVSPTAPSARLQPRLKRLPMRLPVAFGQAPSPTCLGVTTNISTRGLGLTAPRVPQAGAHLHLMITLPWKENIHTEGQVVWARPETSSGVPGVLGIRLVGNSDRYREFVLSALSGTRRNALANQMPVPSEDAETGESTERIWIDPDSLSRGSSSRR